MLNLHDPHTKNNHRLLVYFIAFCMIFQALQLTGCGGPVTLQDPVTVTDYKLNTFVSISAYTTGGYSTKELNQVLKDALSLCDTYENEFSRTRKDSTLSKVNRKELTQIPEELGMLISLGLEYSALSDGAFDITIGSVSSLWDFTAEKPVVPEANAIQAGLKHVNYKNVQLSQNADKTWEISIPDGTVLDLGAIAKGYIADRIADYLKEKQIDRAVINLGGNVYCVGEKSNGNAFHIGIKKPFSEKGEILTTLSASNLSIVSSGNYERYFVENDKLYHHILNPKTGYPYENDIVNVSILSDSSVIGDCLSTTCFALGTSAGLELIESLPNVEALFYTKDGSFLMTSGFEKYIVQ